MTAAERQRRIDEACRQLADARATLRDDIGPGWAPAAARGLATDHHQALHAHLVAHPEATIQDLVELMHADTPKRAEPVNTSSFIRPVGEVLAERPQRDEDLNREALAGLRRQMHPHVDEREAG